MPASRSRWVGITLLSLLAFSFSSARLLCSTSREFPRVQAAAQLARHVAIVAVFDIGARQLLVLAGHQLVFHRLLDLVDIDARLLLHALSDHAGDGGAVVGVDHAHRQRGALDGLRDARFVKRYRNRPA